MIKEKESELYIETAPGITIDMITRKFHEGGYITAKVDFISSDGPEKRKTGTSLFKVYLEKDYDFNVLFKEVMQDKRIMNVINQPIKY